MIYDPLTMKAPPTFPPTEVKTYWEDTCPKKVTSPNPLKKDLTTEVAIIGGGYTGLSTAWFLKQHSLSSVVLEAKDLGFGGSGRNGSIAIKKFGRLSYSKMIKLWGVDKVREIFNEFDAAFSTFEEMRKGISCDVHAGHIMVAHRAKDFLEIQKTVTLLKKTFNRKVACLKKEEVEERFFKGAENFGALHYEEDLVLNPLKLLYGLFDKFLKAGLTYYNHSPVLSCEYRSGKHRLVTPGGVVTAKYLVYASNAYTSNRLSSVTRNTIFPVLSNMIVTRPLKKEETEACQFRGCFGITDTRFLRYYYRRTPDNRILIGGRSAVSPQGVFSPKHNQLLLETLKKKFPVLKNITYDYHWFGWVGLTWDDLPHVYQDENNILYALGYAGNGIVYSIQAAKRLTEMILGLKIPPLPFYTRIPRFPLARFRRLGQSLAYRYFAYKDK